MSDNQHTIKQEASLSGIGLHTGKQVNITFKPAPVNTGIKFQRVDLDDKPVIPADVARVVSTNRGTTIKNGEAQVSTIEHMLSALMGLGVDNLMVEIDGPEVP
ncbi:MAG: UDP-3-O-acyl-N-acetylglucosamine deacetylase, partial [Saprospiraceae bacterium]|nr:UDP-3-O-acyl-N-acetylglucosamine deacetylase [Saprospiraceae bacterium]